MPSMARNNLSSGEIAEILAKPAGLGTSQNSSINIRISRKKETRSKTEGCK